MGRKEDRAADSKPCDTLTDVRLCTSQRGETEKRSLNKRPTAKLSVHQLTTKERGQAVA